MRDLLTPAERSEYRRNLKIAWDGVRALALGTMRVLLTDRLVRCDVADPDVENEVELDAILSDLAAYLTGGGGHG